VEEVDTENDGEDQERVDEKNVEEKQADAT